MQFIRIMKVIMTYDYEWWCLEWIPQSQIVIFTQNT